MLLKNRESFPSIGVEEGLICLGSRLVVPKTGALRENLFRMAHDTLGHFCAGNWYANLRSAYYWPRMSAELENACIKGSTKRPIGPQYPLPIQREEAIAWQSISWGPFQVDDGYDCIVTMADMSGVDICIIPTGMDISAEELAGFFFNYWYSENGLPREIYSDRGKLFISRSGNGLLQSLG